MKREKRSSILTLMAFLGLLLFAACEEQAPPGLDLGGGSKVADSSYTAPLESKQDRVVFIEELTGVDCSNCPKAAKIIKDMSTANPGRILSVGMHPPSSGFTEPIFGKSKLDFRHPEVDEIAIKLGGVGPLPSASLNRERTSNNKLFDTERGSWSTRIAPWLNEETPVNISLISTYTADNNTCEVLARVAFTAEVTEDLYITMYVIEDDIKDYQNDSGFKDPDYKHQHVFRDCITPIAGSSLNFSDKNAGTVLQKRVEFSPVIEGINGWNLDNCKIIAFVHKSGTDQSIIHAQEVVLK